MASNPLTHHEIVGLIEPFARRGRHVDLAATDRLARCIVFKPIERAHAPAAAALQETLKLDSYGTGTFRLTRLVTAPGGLQASLQATGSDPAELLAQVEAVPPQHHFRMGEGYAIARSYSLQNIDGKSAAGVRAVRPVLTRGVAALDGLIVTLSVSGTRGISAELVLDESGDQRFDLPQDLLAVLGWNWARLIRTASGWKTKLRLRGDSARRTRGAEAGLEAAAAHLAHTLAEPPSRFHERWVAARWGVVLRRAIPVLTFVALIASVLVSRRFFAVQNPGLLMLMYHVPTALIALSFCLQELPQYEIPPRPRRSAASSWRLPRAGAGPSEAEISPETPP